MSDLLEEFIFSIGPPMVIVLVIIAPFLFPCKDKDCRAVIVATEWDLKNDVLFAPVSFPPGGFWHAEAFL